MLMWRLWNIAEIRFSRPTLSSV